MTVTHTPIVFQVPRNMSATDLTKIETSLASQFQSTLSIRNEVPDIHQFTVEWNTDAIESAKKSVLAVLSNWEGVRPKQFIVAFTNSFRDRLVDIISVKYSIENGKVNVSATECSHEIYAALTGPDVQEFLSRLTIKQQSSTLPIAVIRCKPANINSVIRAMDFKSFENNLDGHPKICKYDLSKESMPEAFRSASSIIKKMLLLQKKDQGPYKLSFALPQNGKIKVHTTRMQGFVSFRSHNLGEMNEDVHALLRSIQDQKFKILNLTINGTVIKASEIDQNSAVK